MTSRCQGLFPRALLSAEKSPGNEVSHIRAANNGQQVAGHVDRPNIF